MAKRNERVDLLSSGTGGNTNSRKTTRAGSQNELRSEPWSSRGSRTTAIKFGSPSDNRTTTSSTSNNWGRLLSQAARGGISSVFGGGGGILGAIGGLGGILSGIFSLFGSGKKSPPPLSLFQLPSSQAQTVYLAPHAQSGPAPSHIYGTSAAQPTLQYHSAEVAQAVKQALLTSSSLNDVIAEL
ncbi:MAG TPA: hypothetical protein VKX25_02820 [Bryobacteraceae bacterium]|jgi:hypothetical protein|nr:hypothetical protein [Bryobacteraceae bacterium]